MTAHNSSPVATNRPNHRMVDRVSAILEAAARSRAGLTLTELAAHIDAPLSSTQGLANGLVATGYLIERDRTYHLGPAPFFLTRLAGASPVDAVASEHLQEIHAATGHTVVLAIAVGDGLYYVDHVAESARYSYLAENFIKRSLIRASSGWILLSGMSRRDLWSYLSLLPPEDEPFADEFLDSLHQIQTDQIVVAPTVSTSGIEGIATSVTSEGEIIGSVAVIGDHEEILNDADTISSILLDYRSRWSS
ncbi:helix-turn-helix domain-containing protein [Brevibacterium sp. CBA3109]|uniref:Helix-turn-helix domain-containing protein n=1 Tax=Brevibacterium koreense TaxID=3140787 RepID=A0AAU7UMP5_9MICO